MRSGSTTGHSGGEGLDPSRMKRYQNLKEEFILPYSFFFKI
jgi:hypothetical protein